MRIGMIRFFPSSQPIPHENNAPQYGRYNLNSTPNRTIRSLNSLVKLVRVVGRQQRKNEEKVLVHLERTADRSADLPTTPCRRVFLLPWCLFDFCTPIVWGERRVLRGVRRHAHTLRLGCLLVRPVIPRRSPPQSTTGR